MAADLPLPYFFQHLSREISDNSIGTGVSTGGVGATAGGIVKAVALAGGVGVDGDGMMMPEPRLRQS